MHSGALTKHKFCYTARTLIRYLEQLFLSCYALAKVNQPPPNLSMGFFPPYSFFIFIFKNLLTVKNPSANNLCVKSQALNLYKCSHCIIHLKHGDVKGLSVLKQYASIFQCGKFCEHYACTVRTVEWKNSVLTHTHSYGNTNTHPVELHKAFSRVQLLLKHQRYWTERKT